MRIKKGKVRKNLLIYLGYKFNLRNDEILHIVEEGQLRASGS